MTRPPCIEVDDLIARYDAFLLDAYGVLVDSHRALPGAIAFVERLERAGKRWLVLSNDASRLPSTSATRYRGLGLPIDEDRILTSGDLIAPFVATRGLQGGRAIVLGPDDSAALVHRAGLDVVDPSDAEPDAVIVCDDDGYPFLPTIEAVISTLYACMDRQREVELVLPNPDLVYPRGPRAIGVTAGTVAAMIEGALSLRRASRPLLFTRLGKPHRPMFEAAQRRLSFIDPTRVVMLGDQLATDIAGANAFGIDSVLLGTGLTDVRGPLGEGPRPTWILPCFDDRL